MNYCNINGKIIAVSEAGLPVCNGAFRYGYGLFETMLIQEGAIRLSEFHWDRLFAGMKQLYFEISALVTPEWLQDQVLQTVKKNQAEKLCRVRLQVFAGGGGFYSSENRQPEFVIECFPLETCTLKLNENGLVAGIAMELTKSTDSLSNLKSCNALIYAIAARQAKEHKWNDALICNTHGNIIESTIANVFWVRNGVAYTPPLSEGCVAGVMRRHIISRIPIIEKTLHVDELLQADELFFTNSIRQVRWVSSIVNKKYENVIAKDIFNICNS